MFTRPVTVAETAVFIRQATSVWSDEERSEFVDFIARHPEAGDLIPQSGEEFPKVEIDPELIPEIHLDPPPE